MSNRDCLKNVTPEITRWPTSQVTNIERGVILGVKSPVSDELLKHIERVKCLHQRDLVEGFGEVSIPGALARKYKKVAKQSSLQYVFPSRKRSIDPRSGKERRHHVLESCLQKAVKAAVRKAGLISVPLFISCAIHL